MATFKNVSELASANKELGCFFFDKATMKEHGDTLRNFRMTKYVKDDQPFYALTWKDQPHKPAVYFDHTGRVMINESYSTGFTRAL